MTFDNENWTVNTNKRLWLLWQTSDAMTRQQHPNEEDRSPVCDLLSHVRAHAGRGQPFGCCWIFVCIFEGMKWMWTPQSKQQEDCERTTVLWKTGGAGKSWKWTRHRRQQKVNVKSGRFGRARINSARGWGGSDYCLLKAFWCFNPQLLTCEQAGAHVPRQNHGEEEKQSGLRMKKDQEKWQMFGQCEEI